MKVAEKFVSINGEGRRAGELALFIRFQGCNLSCSYCDTAWANEATCPYEDLSPAELRDYAVREGIKNITLTGGEPLLQEGLKELIGLFLAEGFHVEIETNGAVSLAPFCGASRPTFTVDYKLPDSGCEEAMVHANFDLLQRTDTVKFVVSSRRDLERAREVVDTYGLLFACGVYVSPVFGSIETEEIVEFMKARRLNGWRLQIQMHKVIWEPEKRGV